MAVKRGKKWWIAHSGADLISMIVFAFGGLFLLWYELCHILPTYYRDSCITTRIHYAFTFFLAFQIYANMFFLVTTDTVAIKADDGGGNRGRFCDICVMNAPPRSHHCKICNECIEKRDHHCWFAGSCVGLRNHRFYVAMVIYMFIAAVYCNVFNYAFVISVKGPLSISNVATFCLPHVALMFGLYDVYTFAITCLSSIGFMLMVLFGWMLQIQIAQIYRGQTAYERRKNLPGSDRGWRKNLRDVLGRNYARNLLLPFCDTGLAYGEAAYRFNDGSKVL